MEAGNGKGFLAGLRVIELCDMVAGPYCARLLADFGATVTKVEPPGGGDAARCRGPFFDGRAQSGSSLAFLYLNANKRGVTLSLDHPEGQELFRQLVKTADVVVEDRPPGLLGEVGLGYGALSRLNPSLICLSLTPFGLQGPYAGYKAYPLNTFHSGGEGHVTPGNSPFPERPPLKLGGYASEYTIGAMAATSVQIALLKRGRSGVGEHIDLSKQRVLMAICGVELLRYPNQGHVMTRATRGYRLAGVCRCRDGYVELTFQGEEHWRALKEIMGSPEWAEKAEYATLESRERHATEINKQLEAWLMQHDKEELYALARQKGIPLAPYRRIDEVAQARQLKARGFFATLSDRDKGSIQFPFLPFLIAGHEAAAVVTHAPALGEHNGLVYGKELNLNNEALRRLQDAGVI
ncbi:MAG: CoA transferase [Chloroflexi bacterium]|nr:CoA transferase [Chloroflexota bacterium]